MWDRQDLAEVIRRTPAVADDALLAAQHSADSPPIDLRAFTAAAHLLGEDPADFCLARLAAMHRLRAFADALTARGVAVGSRRDEARRLAERLVARAEAGEAGDAAAADATGDTDAPSDTDAATGAGSASRGGASGARSPGGASEGRPPAADDLEAEPDDEAAAEVDAAPARPRGRLDVDALARFADRARTIPCRVQVDGRFAGTGCLVAPGLVLTAWHVVRTVGPGQDEDPPPTVTVRLADRKSYPAGAPLAYASECGDGEWESRAPRSDDEVKGRHDVVLLPLRTEAARHLGYARLPATAPPPPGASRLFVLDYPKGDDLGIGDGRAWPIPDVTERLYHDVETAGGSSGGACFDDRFELIGLHQGAIGGPRDDGVRGRLVPLSAFFDGVAPLVAAGIAPKALWRLDGQTHRLVIGRDLFAAAVAEAGRDGSRVRGIRLKRRNPASGDETGFGFSSELLQELLLRRAGSHVLVRVPLDESVDDLLADVADRARDVGLDAGDRRGAGTPRDRADRLAEALDRSAADDGRIAWFFTDNPSLQLTESARAQLEAFVAACLERPRLRLVIAGLETIPLAGLEFSSAAAAGGDGPAGMVVDYLGGFTADDVRACCTLAYDELTGDHQSAVIDAFVVAATAGLANVNGVYASVDLAEVSKRLLRLLPAIEPKATRGGAR
ncbi:trypsin-like serine peptidase [Agromyces sp. MMS24-K17]|uniref:trypsin-like serine peptidase n=1 Tax=Agromyces sp. MMS24-K17 TaxID=3372850 RepID=UPI0037542A95